MTAQIAPVTFEPAKDIALIALIGLIKKLGHHYATGNWGDGLRVHKDGYTDERRGVLRVYYSAGSYSSDQKSAVVVGPEKLANLAIDLIEHGLGVEPRMGGEPERLLELRVFAYDITADLEAYKAQRAADAREAARVTPEVKVERIAEAKRQQAERVGEAMAELQKAYGVRETLADLATAIENGRIEDAVAQAHALQGVSFKSLGYAVNALKYGRDQIKRAENLELVQ